MIKATKFGEDWLNGFRAIEQKLDKGPVWLSPPLPPPVQIGLS